MQTKRPPTENRRRLHHEMQRAGSQLFLVVRVAGPDCELSAIKLLSASQKWREPIKTLIRQNNKKKRRPKNLTRGLYVFGFFRINEQLVVLKYASCNLVIENLTGGPILFPRPQMQPSWSFFQSGY